MNYETEQREEEKEDADSWSTESGAERSHREEGTFNACVPPTSAKRSPCYMPGPRRRKTQAVPGELAV